MKMANHNLSHDIKLTGNMGELIPIACFEALPGDVVNHEAAMLIRTQPLVTPVMHAAEAKIHTWFVPSRIIWSEFEDFITGGRDGLNASVPPTISFPTGIPVGSLGDYLGLPTGTFAQTVSALPFRAYALIFNEFYRDQDLTNPLNISLASGADTTTSTTLQNACWDKDYFTSARPSPQKGATVTVPLTGNAPVIPTTPTTPLQLQQTNTPANWGSAIYNTSSGSGANMAAPSGGVLANGVSMQVRSGSMIADLASVAGISLNDLRLVAALQRFRENMSRFGSRYNERLEAFFGVKNLDGRLQLPEYLGGGTQNIQFSEVLQTAEGSNPVATMRGHGLGAMRSNRYKTKIPEYGYIISLLIVRPRTQYMDGQHKMWFRSTKEDYYQPELENLGQQTVQNRELYAAHTTPSGTFGFQDRYDEYRRIESRISGDFRTTLDSWHMARKFTSDPALNDTFVRANPTNRIYAVTSADQLLVYVNHNLYMRRRLAKIAKPKLF